MMIIGIAGFIGSGKDTLADYLQNFHGFRRDSFAAPLKDSAAAIFGWDREMLEGRTKESRQQREQVDTWWAEQLGIPNFTPRLALQLLGTEAVRKGIHDKVWIASLANRMRRTTDHMVITDCRFPNEIRAIKDGGGLVVRIARGADPEWYALAETANRYIWSGDPAHKDASERAEQQLNAMGVHASERAWIGAPFDALIDNNGKIDALYDQIEALVSRKPQVAMAA